MSESIDTPTTRILRRPWEWLIVIGVAGLLGMGWLWSLRTLGQICTLQYPPTPGCGAPQPMIVPFVVMGLVIAAWIAAAIVWFLVPRPRLWLILLSAFVVLAVLIGAGIIGLSQTGLFDPYSPPILID
jgi:hypothetical protein